MTDTNVGARLAHIGNYLMDMREHLAPKGSELEHHLNHVYTETRKAESEYWAERKKAS